MIARYHPRQATHPAASSPTPPPHSAEATPGASSKEAIRDLVDAGKDAVRHGATVARVRAWRLRDTVRTGIARLALWLMAALVLLGVVVTAAIWGTANLLRELSLAMGGGLLGCALALGTMLCFAMAVAGTVSFVRRRARIARWRSRLAPSVSQGGERVTADSSSGEPDELQRLEQVSQQRLQRDKDRMLQAGSDLVRGHPVLGLGVGAASGFLAGRSLTRHPQAGRRAAAKALRMARAAGSASLVHAVSSVLRGEADAGGEAAQADEGAQDAGEAGAA